MHTFTYRKLPIIERGCFDRTMMEKGISFKEMPFDWWVEDKWYGSRKLYRPVAIERRTYGSDCVALYAVIYRDVHSATIHVRHAWGKLKPTSFDNLYQSAGESD